MALLKPAMLSCVQRDAGDAGLRGEGQSRATYRFGVLDKHLAPPHLVLVWVHVDRAQQVLHPLPLVPTPGWPRLGGEDGVAAGTGDVSRGRAAGTRHPRSRWPLTVAGTCGRGGGRRNPPGALGCSPSAPGTRLGASPCGAGRDPCGVGRQVSGGGHAQTPRPPLCTGMPSTVHA